MRIMSAVHPTANQKRVLAKIVASPTPTVAAEQISNDANIVAARNMLMKMGIITLANNEAALTDRGKEVATDENIIDQSGQLTSTGEKLAYTDTNGMDDDDNAGQLTPPTDSAEPPPPGGDIPFESVSLLKQLLS